MKGRLCLFSRSCTQDGQCDRCKSTNYTTMGDCIGGCCRSC